MSYSVIATLVHGEQIRLSFTVGWIADLSGYTVSARLVEGFNDGSGSIPLIEDATLTITTLPILNKSGNGFQVVIPATAIDTWNVKPTPSNPVYGFFDLQIQDAGAGDAQQIFRPVQGLIQFNYSPFESVA